MTLTKPIYCSYKPLWWSLWALSLICWPLNASCSNQWPCDMCHSLIDCKKAQSMCSPLIQSKPSIIFLPSLHPSPWSLKPFAYLRNPLPSHFNTITHSNKVMPFWSWSKAIMPFWDQAFTSKIHPSTSKFQESSEASLSTLSIHPKSISKLDTSINQEKNLIERAP